MAFALATNAPGVSSGKSAYKTNPYEVPTYGGSGAGSMPPPPQESTINATPGYVPGQQAAPAPMAPPLAQPSAPPAPAAAKGAPEEQAMQGLSMAMNQSGPTPGWADDAALSETSGELGNRVGNDALGILSELVSKRGRLY